MKKVILLLGLILVSCSKDSGGDSPNPEPPEEKLKFTLTVSAGEGGSVDTAGGTYDEGTTLTVTATPDAEYLFNNWSGTKNSTNNPLRFILTSNENIIANFELKNSNNNQNPDNPIGPVKHQD